VKEEILKGKENRLVASKMPSQAKEGEGPMRRSARKV